jgi:hypothetical protein
MSHTKMMMTVHMSLSKTLMILPDPDTHDCYVGAEVNLSIGDKVM